MTKLTIVAKIVAAPEKADFVKSELLKLIPITRKEAGCINYDLHQDNEKSNFFMFYENWETRELWQQHMNAQHLKDYVKATEGCIKVFEVHEMSTVE